MDFRDEWGEITSRRTTEKLIIRIAISSYIRLRVIVREKFFIRWNNLCSCAGYQLCATRIYISVLCESDFRLQFEIYQVSLALTISFHPPFLSERMVVAFVSLTSPNHTICILNPTVLESAETVGFSRGSRPGYERTTFRNTCRRASIAWLAL